MEDDSDLTLIPYVHHSDSEHSDSEPDGDGNDDEEEEETSDPFDDRDHTTTTRTAPNHAPSSEDRAFNEYLARMESHLRQQQAQQQQQRVT